MKAKRKNKMRGRVVPDEYERQGLLDDSDDGENPDRHSANLLAAKQCPTALTLALTLACLSAHNRRDNDDKHSQGGSTRAQLCANLITGGLGSGILSLPWGMAGASISSGLLLTLAVLLVNGFTIMILVHAAERHQRFDLGSLLSLLPGRGGFYARWFCNGAVWLSTWMVLLGYVIVVQDSFTALVPKESIWASRPLWAFLASLVAFPLCLLELRRLAFSSMAVCRTLRSFPSLPLNLSPTLRASW